MRTIPPALAAKFKQLVQADSTKAAPALDLWISRPVVPLVNDYFLEQQAVQDASDITAVDIAVCHPKHRRQSTKIYMAKVEGGTAKVLSSPFRYAIEAHIWTDSGFSEPAEDVALAFDAVMKNDTRGRSEFVTEDLPWIFWVRDGALYGRKLGSTDTLTLAEANCTKCTAIRAAGSAMGGFDYGLCLFFLLSGAIYVRQLIGGEWMDAEPIGFGPDGVTWTDIAASRSWDYRVVLQALAGDGTLYELYTQYMGIGQRSVEHISLAATAAGQMTAIKYHDSKPQDEHLSVSASASGEMIWGLSSVVLSAANVEDDSGNWGTIIDLVLDHPVTGAAFNVGAFSMTDSEGATYSCTGAAETEQGLRLTFVDFNLAEGRTLTVIYTPGTIQSPATALEGFEFTFTPENLVAPAVGVPEVVEAWNLDADGTQVAIRFSEGLTGDVSGLIGTPAGGYKQQAISLEGATVTALNEYSTSYPATNVVDGSTSTYWRGTTAVNWLQIQLPEAKLITGLRMYLGSYYISTFTISGSNDGETWTQLGDTFTAASSTTEQWYDFVFDNNTAYQYYRIDTLTAYNATRIYIYEIELQEPSPLGNEVKFTVSGQMYNYVPGGELLREARTVTRVDRYYAYGENFDVNDADRTDLDITGDYLSLGVDV